MVTMQSTMFADEAVRVGRFLTGSAIRHANRCTWLDDDAVAHDGWWSRKARAIGPTFGAGTCGIGWFLAHLHSITPDRMMATIAAEALRQSLQGADAVLAPHNLGFHDGAFGLAWALVDAGRAIPCQEFIDEGIRIGLRAVEILETDPESVSLPSLWRGRAGVFATLLALARSTQLCDFMKPVSRLADGLVTQVSQWNRTSRLGVGLAEGASGVAVMLAGWYGRTNDTRAREAALEALRIERPWSRVPERWSGAPAHEWADASLLGRSLCSGAAGLALARLKTYACTRDLNLLAEASAAIELIRRRPMDGEGSDLSLCHGTAGEIEMMISASTILSERSHLEAARRLGTRLIASARANRAYESGSAESYQGPSFQFGLSGLGLVYLRLHDPALGPLPPIFFEGGGSPHDAGSASIETTGRQAAGT